MQIPIIQVLEKMELELRIAKQSSNDGLVKEKLAIIKALCEVALNEPNHTITTKELEKPIIENVNHTNHSLLDF